jgi:hypothetical protein
MQCERKVGARILYRIVLGIQLVSIQTAGNQCDGFGVLVYSTHFSISGLRDGPTTTSRTSAAFRTVNQETMELFTSFS